MRIVPSLAMLQSDPVGWVQTRLLGYDEPPAHHGPYETEMYMRHILILT